MNDINTKKRPVWVWLICAYYSISFCWTIFSYLLISLHLIPLTEPQKQYFENLTVIDYLMTFGIGVFGLFGAIFLFLMKKQTVKLFGLMLILDIVATVWQLFEKNLATVLSPSGLVGMCIGIGIIFVIFMYTRSLDKRGLFR